MAPTANIFDYQSKVADRIDLIDFRLSSSSELKGFYENY